jgi:hypothetical protein
MRLLITRITALNARLIAHLETERSVSTCCGSTSKSSEEWAPEHVNASSIHVGRVVAYPDRTAFLGDYFRIAGNPPETRRVGFLPAVILDECMSGLCAKRSSCSWLRGLERLHGIEAALRLQRAKGRPHSQRKKRDEQTSISRNWAGFGGWVVESGRVGLFHRFTPHRCGRSPANVSFGTRHCVRAEPDSAVTQFRRSRT